MGYPHARIVDSPTASFYHCIITYTQHAMERVSTPPLPRIKWQGTHLAVLAQTTPWTAGA